ncbi:hypothetical protein PQ455_02605 [Sphingomonas naphthae]|uniref:2-keto-4-pentenoate hydratase n=1 Tax=Sphingomonas naphthae TaxID=1813468 RepID=A0ABY7TM81_9SPHN|nr:hypothetical protein [Sphingomonas naphthae]WCT74143.1 hypothetical protein PQ455_02605 [Sphingomonas naphthae]
MTPDDILFPSRRSLIGGSILGLAGLAWQARAAKPVDPYVTAYLDAAKRGVRYAPISRDRPGLTNTQGYAIQHAIVDAGAADGPIVAFKGGLMSAEAQRRYRADGPAFGAIRRAGTMAEGATVPLSAYRNLVLETEIAFTLARPIRRPVKDIATLQTMIGAIRPAIELPDVALDTADNLTQVDVIAANYAAARYIPGKPSRIDRAALNDVKVTLYRDGVAVAKGAATESLGDQWRAIFELVNCIVGAGYVLGAGQTILTGALGGGVPARPGVYRADYGSFGAIDFTIA